VRVRLLKPYADLRSAIAHSDSGVAASYAYSNSEMIVTISTGMRKRHPFLCVYKNRVYCFKGREMWKQKTKRAFVRLVQQLVLVNLRIHTTQCGDRK